MADYSTYLTGWRLWRIKEHLGVPELCPVWIDHAPAWPGRQPASAQCLIDPVASRRSSCSLAPTRECGCGLYAYRLRTPVGPEFNYAKGDLWDRWAGGRVALWGRLLEHQAGYRAEYAYPLSLFVPATMEAYVPGLGQHYGVPVQVIPGSEVLGEALLLPAG